MLPKFLLISSNYLLAENSNDDSQDLNNNAESPAADPDNDLSLKNLNISTVESIKNCFEQLITSPAGICHNVAIH